MPNALTHYVFAEDVLSSLPDKIRSLVECREKLYYFASMGGDVLYGLNFSSDKVKRGYGDVVHSVKVRESFEEALNKELSEDNLAFLLGFITHYALDSVMHPYIFYAQKTKVAPHVGEGWQNNTHMLVETELDAYYAMKRFGDPYYKSTLLFSCGRDVKDATYNFYNHTVKESLNLEVSRGDASLAVTAWRLFTYLLHKGSAAKKLISNLAEKILSSPHLFTAGYRQYPLPEEWDVLNEKRTPFPTTTDGDGTSLSEETVAELYDKALKKAVLYVTTFFEAKENGDTSLNLDFSLNYDGRII